jgi:uncharacterized protein YabE (DUF348 family)
VRAWIEAVDGGERVDVRSQTVGERPRQWWRRRLLLVGALGALVLFTAVPIAAAATTFAVPVAVDGEILEARTRGGTVADVLERLELSLGPNDTVDPPLDAAVEDGTRITVGRAVHVAVHDDGTTHHLDAVVATVADVLDGLELELGAADVVTPALDAPVDDGSEVTVERAIRVLVRDDGQPHELVAAVGTVAEALDALELELATADVVTPALDAPIADGARIVVDRAVTVDVAVNGAVARRITAPLTTVEQVLRRAGMEQLLTADVRIEPPADRPVADGDTVHVTLPVPVRVVADGEEATVATYGPDVAAALADAGLELGADDRVAPPANTAIVGPTRITVQRVRHVGEIEEIALAHRSVRRETDDLAKGSTRVEVEGRDGLRIDTYRVTLVDGEASGRALVSEEVVREPRDEVVLVGTYVAPPPPPPPAATPAGSGASDGGSGGSGGSSAGGGGGTSSPQGYLVAPGSNAGGSGATVTYSVEVEAGLGLDPGSVAATVDAALLDQRSWARDRRMERVSNPASARIRVLVASPATVDRLCRAVGLDTGGYLSCWTGRFAALNVNRWWNGVPSFSDIALYRRYLVNHEVGHGLGFGHVGCPASGALAPVMMQQSISLGGCRPNGWPHPG